MTFSSPQLSSLFMRDLKQSKFFKIYFGLAVFLAFFFIFGLFVGAIRAAIFDVATGWRFYLVGYTQLNFPQFIQFESPFNEPFTSNSANCTCLVSGKNMYFCNFNSI